VPPNSQLWRAAEAGALSVCAFPRAACYNLAFN